MGKSSWEATDNDREIARFGITMQAGVHHLDVNDPNVKAFIEHLVEVSATDAAQMRFKEKCLAEIWQAKIDNFQPGDVVYQADTYGEWIYTHGEALKLPIGTHVEVQYKGQECTFNEVTQKATHPNGPRIKQYRVIYKHEPWSKI